MTQSYIFSRIESAPGANHRLYFKTYKSPKFGQFVKLSDHDELKAKGYTRFVSDGNSELFHTSTERNKFYVTLLIKVDDIKEMITYEATV